MKLFRVWDDYSQVETEMFFFDENLAEWFISTRSYPNNWVMDSVETYDSPKED